MADWSKITSRGNVEDRRAFGASGAGGLGLAGVAIYLIFTYLSGGSVTDAVVSQLQNIPVQTQTIDTKQFEGADSYEVFTSTVLGSVNDMWANIFAQQNRTYTPPKLVLFRGNTNSGCGQANTAIGPFYCPTDETVYLDETFFNELQSRFGGDTGDVAQANVIAHEVGHHAQNLLGISDDVSSNSDSVKLELEADCFAGLWANSIKDKGVFASGEINEALSAASAVGDDHIQEVTTGRVRPDSFTHGTSLQRVSWFTKGFDTGVLSQCDTFNS